MDFVTGEVLLLNKPYKWTSFDLVRKVRNLTKKITHQKLKVGHAGTLDPLATGLLIICTGKKTKEIDSYQGKEKEYIATVKFGATTPSFDLETEVNQTFETTHITEELLKETLQSFVGKQSQVPPLFSAKMIDGKRAYEHARKGDEIEMKPSIIEISEIELISPFSEFPETRIRIVCSKGTYIRSFAHDIGKKLNSGAHLAGLIRTRIGDFLLKNAILVEDLQKLLTTV